MKYLLLLFIAMSSFRAFGQYSLNGQVTDSTTSAPLDYIEIILKSPDNEWSNLSDEQGKYNFENLAPGMYQLIVNYNFEQVYNQSIEIESDLEKNLKIKIKEIQLNEVVVRQKVFQKKSDRFVYDVSISSKAKGNNAFGLLQETPLVSSTDGKSLKILGKSSAIIYINGRKTNMDAEAITEYLKNIPSEQIQRIEVITTPGSEYQVEANDGIINIVMKKQLSDGYNGTLKLSDNQGYYNNPGAGANFNFRKNKLAINTGINAGSFKDQEKYALSNGNDEFRNETFGSSTDPNLNFGGNISADYSLTKRQSLGMTYNFRFNKSYNSLLEVDNYSSGILDNRTTNKENALTRNHSANLNYEIKTDSLGSKLSANISFLKYERKMNSTNESAPAGGGIPSIFHQSVPQYIDNVGALLDYVHKTKGKTTWMFGGSYNNTKTDNDTNQDMISENGYVNNEARSNHFVYEENIIGLYATLELTMNEKFSTKVGTRFENTNSEGRVLDKAIGFKRNYNNILPYLNVNYSINEDNSLTYSFSSRVRRPTFWELNPIRRYFTPNNYLQNNPFVLASKNYNQELNYMFKNAYYAIVQYQIVKDASGQIPMQGIQINNATMEETRFLRYIRTNYGNKEELSLSLGMNKSWFDGIWSANYMAALEYDSFKGTVTSDPTYLPEEGITETLFPYSVDNANTNLFLQINNNIRLTSKKDLFLGINYWYLSPKQIELGKLATLQSLDVNVKKIWKSWTFMVEIEDILRTNVEKITGEQSDGYYNNVENDDFNRQMNVRVTYNFGNQKLKKAREMDAINSTMKGRL